ncbi:hypothetical protein GQ464_009705 [Rhodocaloribacter litoris]|uniref:hypothetical protein n=1 Tax=Rhodocaloribacter litoris TaxID=2558931 RepID=UPI0014240F2E|nr:hypothetical protein [Rhodocaloribacter litoris]QXD13749.1 hypothetical protein GQ464_009705 [Rhodocaloribacter litoris]
MKRCVRCCLLFVTPWLTAAAVLLCWAGPARGQGTEAEENPYGTGLGAQVLLTNSGFGLGGYYHLGLTPSVSFLVDLSLAAGKDEREVAFFDRFGRKDIPDKANYLLMLPAQVGFQQRLFRESIEDNFRPYLQVTTGPTFGWEYPYFLDDNGNGTLDEGEKRLDSISALPKGRARFGLGGTLALGAHLGRSRSVVQGVRLGYTFTYFFQGIQLLEPTVQEAQHFFGTPTLTFLFGKLF